MVTDLVYLQLFQIFNQGNYNGRADKCLKIKTPWPLGWWFYSFQGDKLMNFLTTYQIEINTTNKLLDSHANGVLPKRLLSLLFLMLPLPTTP